jgi:hypothetical protein
MKSQGGDSQAKEIMKRYGGMIGQINETTKSSNQVFDKNKQ